METIADDLAEELFVLMTMGDDRSVRATYVAGERRTPPDGSGPHAHKIAAIPAMASGPR